MTEPRILLDTSAYSGFNRGDERLIDYFKPERELLVPLVVVGELRAGFALGNKQHENAVLLQKFLDSPNVHTITITDTTTQLFAALYQRLKMAGTPIGTNDMWIAALALEHDSMLVTLDSDFQSVPDLLIATI